MALFLKNSNDNQNAQVATTQRAQRSSSPQNYTTQITTTKGTQYTLDNNQVDWIKSRYKQDGADTYGWDDADQYAKQTGQLSAKMRSTYKNSNVDRQLAEMGLPSEKNLEKYIADYQNWHTGGISDYFGKDVPQDFYTKTKDMFKGDWQYDDTQEDQLRKSSGQMPSKLASKYTDTEIDDELRAAGLPPVAEMGKYIGRYNNYSAIDNFYKNASVAWANLGMTQDKNGQYIQNDNKVYTMEDGRQRKGKDLYAEAFYNELRRRDEKEDYVYGNIFGMFKNNHQEDYDPDDYDGTNYNQYLGKEFVNASKVADLADDYAAYTAFSYDDFAGKYGDYYDKYLKSYKFSDGQTLEEKMNGIAIKNDEQAQREFYDVSDKWFDKGRGTSDFVARYKQMYPNNTYEQMFTDMFENGVPESTIRKTMTTLRNDTSVTGGKNWADDKMSGFKDLTKAYANARQKYLDKQAAPADAIPTDASALTAFDAMQSIEQYMTQNGGWTADNATKAVEALQKAGASYDTIKGAVEEMQDLYGVEHNDVLTALVNASALTYNPNKAELEKIGNEFNALVNGNVDYNKRPIVLPEAMWQAGYTDFDRDDVATTYFTTLGVGEGDNLYTVLATPILNDGTVLSKQELEDYVSSLDTSNGIKGLLDSDKYGIVVNTRQGDYDPEYWDPLIDKLGEIKEQHTDLALPLEFSERTLPQFQKQLRASMEENMKLDGEDKATIETAYESIDKMLTSLITTDEGVASVNDVIAVLNSIENANWNNPVAMEKALEEYGFTGFGQFTGLADKLTKNWSKEDKLKLSYAIGSTRVVDAEAESNDFIDKLSDIFGWGDWLKSGEAPITKRSMMYNDFSYALDWAEEQIANGTLTEAQAYQVLSAEGFSPELEQYVGKDWHEAIYKELMVPQLVQQAGGAQLATWEEMTPEEQQKMATSMYDSLTDEQYAQLFGDADWWKANPNVYRTFGQAFEQQFAALLPSLATDLITSTVELGDMIGAAFTGRPELDDDTQKWLKAQEFVQNYGSVNDDVNGAKIADVMANVAGEILRMQTLGTIGAGVGAGFEATGVGSKIAQLAAGNPGIVKKATGMALSLVRSSPFVANAWAHDYAEWKQMGASNGVAMWNSMITGMAEGILEGLNFDNLWGKVLGQETFATQILDAGKDMFKTAGIVWKARLANMAASGLGEFTEESIGYVVESWRKSRHKELWGDVKLSAGEWLEQAGMGFLVGVIGGGMSSMDINASKIIAEYASSSDEGSHVVFPDRITADYIWLTTNSTAKASYRTGGANVLSTDAYKQLDNEAENCKANAQKVLEQARADEADAAEKINNAEAEVRKLEDKLAPYMLVKGRKESLTGEEAEEFGALYAKWNEAKRHAESVRNEVSKDLAEKAGNHERSLQNAESQLKDLQKKIQEHFCGIHLMNEGATPEQAFENMMNAYQNGFKVEGKAAQTVDTKTENATETNATTETTKDEASVAAREAAYDRVYTDQEAGKAYGNEAKNEKGRKLTRVEFAENERQNFQAKTTAKQGKVTLELAGLEAAEGMSDKEIIAEAKKAMTPDAAKKLDMFMKLSKALGMPMVIRDVVAGTSGYVHDGKLYVTLNGKQALLRVTAHEVTHWMKEHLPSGYDVLRTRLINDVGGQEAFDELVQKKAQEYVLDLNTEKGRLEADDEVCAELCEKMFENKDALEKFVNEAPEAAKTLKARLAKTLVAIKQAIKSLGTSNSETNGDLIKDQDTIELWYKTLSDAIDAANAEAKGNVQPVIEDVATETSTEAHPQAPPAPEGVEELGISSEEVRKQNLRSELEELAKKGTKVKDFDRASVNEILDRVIVGDRTNYSKADYAQIRGMLAQLIPEIKAMVDGDTSVDLDALNERVQTALNYMLDRYSEPSAELYDLREIIPGRIALTETAYNELRNNSEMTLRDASNRMTRALGKFVNFVYKGSPNYSAASTIDEVWRDIGYEPEGQGTIAEDADALIKYVEERAERSSYDDLYKSQRDDLVSAHAGEFLDAVQSIVEGKAAETAALHSIDDDYMPLAERYDAGIATEEETEELQSDVLNAAKEAMPNTKIVDENGNPRIVYHGTSERFTVFDRTKGRSTMDIQGMFFSPYEIEAGGYGENVGSYYLNIQNPATESVAYSALRRFQGQNNAGAKAMEYLASLGYDGVDNGYDEYIAFYPDQIKSADLVTYDDDNNIIPLSERFDPNKVDTRWTVDDDWDEAVRRYGAKPQGMNPRARDVQVPERLNRQSRLSDFLRSLTESGKVTDDQVNDIKKMVVEQNYMSYIPTSVADRMEQAQKYIAQRQPLQAQQEFHDMVTEGKGGANTVALGIQLLSDAAERGDIESVLDTAADLQILATDSGQSVQAFSVLKQLKGVGSAWYMQKLVDRLNSKYADRIAAGKMDTITVSPELMAQLAAATNVNEIEAAEEAVAKEIAGQLPLTWTDRLSNWRYFSMLANPVTHFRNIFGNVLMGGMNMAKDVVATGLERTLNVAEEDRAHAVLTAEDRKTWGDWAQKSYDENARNLRGGGKLGFETFVKQNMRSFDTKFLNALAKFNFDKLEGEDIRFIRPAYKNALMQYMKAQGYTLNAQGEVGKYAADGTFTPISNAKMTEAEEWASNQAWKATFRDASDLATMLNKVSKMNSVSRLLVEGVMPFKKTPINIAKRGIEYSPAGIVMGVAQLTNGVKKGKYTPAQAIDTLASGLTGSALMALGVFLAKLGVIRGGGEDKKKYETYLEDTGDQTYAFKIGDVSINMSSIAPATIPLFMGVALEEMLNRQGDSFDLSTFTDTIAGTLNPLMEMSFMSSLNSALQNYNNNGIGGALGNTVLTAAQNYGSQYLPTAVARLGQLADPVQRTTKSSATSPIGGNMDYYVRSLAKKVPGATTALEPDVNVWGQTNTKDTFGEWLLDVANKFVLPTNVKITNRDAVDKELIRLVESTGGVDFLPSDGNKYFTVSGQTYKMNARQYTEFSKERGEASYAAIKEVMNSPAYVNANDTQRADMLEKALKAAQKQVNTNWKYKLGAFD